MATQKAKSTESFKKKSANVGKQKKKPSTQKAKKLGDKTEIDDETTI